MNYLKRLVLICLLSLCASSVLAETNRIAFPINKADIAITENNGITSFTGAQLEGPAGSPAIPRNQYTFLVEENTDLASLTISVVDTEKTMVPGTHSIAPVAPSVAKEELSWPEGATIVDGKDMNIYAKDAFYPSEVAKVVSISKLWNYKLVTVEVAPYAYNPVTKELVHVAKGHLLLNGDVVAAQPTRAASVPYSFSARAYKRVSALVENEMPYPAIARHDAANNSKYVIITTNAIRDNATELANFVSCKEAMGFTVDVITEDTWGGGSGDAAAENIRRWLKANYITEDIEHVLLIGNPHPTTGDVPMKMTWPRSNASTYREAPTDFYYAELSGNWDMNNNGQFGEYYGDYNVAGGADHTPEISVGRIPVYGNDMVQLDAILTKCITYTNEGNTAWRSTVLLPMEPSDANTPGYHLGEQVLNNLLTPNGVGAFRIYDEDYGVSPDVTPCNVNNVTDSWKANPYGYTLWWTHGSTTTAADIMTTSKATELNDEFPTFTFQVSCNNAWPESSSNLAYAILKNGGIGSVAATRVSWYSPGQTNYTNTTTNAGMGYTYSDRLVAQGQSAGDAFSNVKSDLVPTSYTRWMNWLVFNLYGDPSLALNNEVVETFTIESSVIGGGTVSPYPAWDANTTYSGDTVVYNDTVWRAKWWSLNEAPSQYCSPWQVWEFVRPSVGEAGTIDPEGTTTVLAGGSQTYTMTPTGSGTIKEVTVDGIVIGAPSTYTFNNVRENHTIAVEFNGQQAEEEWIPTKCYNGGAIVKYNGEFWVAQWWNLGVEPTEQYPWDTWKKM